MAKTDKEARYRAVFGGNVAAIRQKRGLTQEQLADKAGLHEDTVSAIENGRRWTTLTTLQALAKALKVEVYQFFIGL